MEVNGSYMDPQQCKMGAGPKGCCSKYWHNSLYRVGMMTTALLPLYPKLRLMNVSQLTVLQFKIHSQQDGLWRDLFGVDQRSSLMKTLSSFVIFTPQAVSTSKVK